MMLSSCGGDDPIAPVVPPEPEEPDTPVEVVEPVLGTFTLSDIVTAAAGMYQTWEATSDFPQTMTVGEVTMTAPQYTYAMCQAILNLAEGSNEDVKVLSYEAADSPLNDTYDQETIAVKSGPQNGIQTEDLANLAGRIIKIARLSGRIPNQTLYTRDGVPVAFGTYRATIAISRALAAYALSGTLSDSISVMTKSPVGTILQFATEFVKILDVWQENVGTIYADSKHSGANAFKEAHFIPTVSSFADSDNNKLPETTITIGQKTFTMDEAWELAITGILDMITLEGSGVMQESIGTPVHTPGDGVDMSSILYDPSKWDRWSNPWYEADETLNLSKENPVTIPLLERLLPWWYKRANDFGYVGNYQYLESFGVEGFTGMMSSMRLLLVMARFYKELLDNNVTENVWTYMKDKTIDPDLYGIIPKEKERINIDLDFYQPNKIGNILYKSASMFPSNGQASVHATYRNDMKVFTYDLQTGYDFRFWARYGISRSTGTIDGVSMIRGMRYNPYSSGSYGATSGCGGWMQLPAIPGFRLVEATLTLYSGISASNANNSGTWDLVSDVAPNADATVYSMASGAKKFGSQKFSSTAKTISFAPEGTELGVGYYLLSAKVYNSEITEIHLVYESD